MGYLNMPKQELSVAMPQGLNEAMQEHLLKADGQEDLLFALWTPSKGSGRLTALLHTAIYPIKGDRQRHGNASFNLQYFERVCQLAVTQRCGIAFLHSHGGPGWQDMSADDIQAEEKLSGAASGLTDLPLLGLTVGTDGTWSARMWEHV